jgi:phospholipase A1
MKRIAIATLAGCAALAAPFASAGDASRCWELEADARLACYDRETGRPRDAAHAVPSASAPAEASTPRGESGARMRGYLAERWAYDVAPGLFTVRQLRENYAIVRYSDRPNVEPHAPDPNGNPVYATVPVDLQHPEIALQLSGKVRVGYLPAAGFDERPAIGDALGFWLAYTQRSHWQAFNGAQSRPFRETNYQPEAIVSVHPQLFVGERSGWNWRLFNVGVGHQSNGQSAPLSRSWNYAFAQLGFELDNDYGQWAVVARPWYRLPESAAKDDNPDLADYIGYGDVRAVWRSCDKEVALMARGNPATGRGAAQLDVSFPLLWNGGFYPFLGYVQVFTGYGESLIDYNWRQTTAGVGVRLNNRRNGSCPD